MGYTHWLLSKEYSVECSGGEEDLSSGETWPTVPQSGGWGQYNQWYIILIIYTLEMMPWKMTFCLFHLPLENT